MSRIKLAAVSVILVLAAAQNPPGCAVGCLSSTQTECSPVSLNNLACLCRSSSAQNALFGCVQGACSPGDLQTARSFFEGVCAAVTQSSSSTSSPTTTRSSPPILDGSPTSGPSSGASGDGTPSATRSSGSGLQTPSSASSADAAHSTQAGPPTAGSTSHPRSQAAVIGGAIGGTIGGLALIGLLALLFLIRRRRQHARRTPRPQTSSEKQFQAPAVDQHGSGDSYNPYVQAAQMPAGASSPETGTPIGPYIARPFVASPTTMEPVEGDGLAPQQREMVQRMLSQGTDAAVVRDVVDRMRADNGGERTAPPRYDFKDSTDTTV